MTTTEWFADYANIVTLTSYLADHGATATDIAYAVEKPWKYEDEFTAALAELNEDVQPGRQSRLVTTGKDGQDPSMVASRTCAPADTSETTR